MSDVISLFFPFLRFLDSAIGRKRTILIFEIFFPIAFILIYFGNGFAVIAAAYLMTGMARGANTNYCNRCEIHQEHLC